MSKLKKYDFSNSFTSINTYVDQNADSFIPAVVGRMRTFDYVTPVLDIKTSKVIPMVTTSIDFVNANSCTSFVNGATAGFVGTTLTVAYIKNEESICLPELELYYPKWFSAGSDQETLPLESAFMEQKLTQISKKLDVYFWQGGAGITGLIATATASSCIVLATQSFSTSTAVSNGVILTFDNMVDQLDSNILSEDDLTLFCGTEVFDKYVRSVRNLNLYHYNAEEIKNGVVNLMGKSNVRLVATVGLDGTNKAFMSKSAWILLGTDVMPDEEPIKGEYSFYYDKYLMRYKVKLGSALAQPTYAIVAKA